MSVWLPRLLAGMCNALLPLSTQRAVVASGSSVWCDSLKMLLGQTAHGTRSESVRWRCCYTVSAALPQGTFCMLQTYYPRCLIRGIVDIAEANRSAFDPSRHGQASAVKGMHVFLRHTDNYYYDNYRSLQDRLTSAVAAAIHLYHLQQEHNASSKALYMDMQCELSLLRGVFEFMQKHFSTRQYFICLRGNDRIETLFSIVRTARGTGGVLDIVQLRQRFDVAAQLEELFALEPKWRLNRKRA